MNKGRRWFLKVVERSEPQEISLPPPDVIVRKVNPIGLGSEISAALIDTTNLRFHLNATRELLVETATTVAESRAIGPELDRVVAQSRARAIQLRSGEVPSLTPQRPHSRKIRSLCVQAQHECQRFLRVTTELTTLIERSAQIVSDSARFLQADKRDSYRPPSLREATSNG